MEWQPIETIPRDRPVLVSDAERFPHCAVVDWYSVADNDVETDGFYISDGKNEPIWHRMQYMMKYWMDIRPTPQQDNPNDNR